MSSILEFRSDAHRVFDTVWKKNHMTRAQAYRWLARCMGLSEDECHMRFMDEEQTKEVIKITQSYLSARSTKQWYRMRK